MAKIKVKKIKNVECYDFESKTSIPYDKTIEVRKTSFVERKIKEGILKEVKTTKAKGGGKDDNSKGGKSKKEG